LQVPPAGGNVGSNGWTSVVGGYRCRINDGTGSINVFLPVNVIDPFNSGANFLTDLVAWPIGANIGEPLSVTGFLRHFGGEFEIVVLYNQPGFIQ
jgi:DNA/RNA endonuclease YhcR with UshA esterase domain